jgi:hypothetical protein
MRKKIFLSIILFSIFLTPFVLNAQQTGNSGSGSVSSTVNKTVSDPNCKGTVCLSNPLKPGVGNDFMSLLRAILNNIVMPIAAVAVVCAIIYSGFTFVTAQGKSEEITKAQQRLLWALIGGGILLGAAGISSVVENTVKSVVDPNSISTSK